MAATRGRPVEALMQPRPSFHWTGSLPTKRRRTDRRRELSAWKNAAARKSVGARFEAPLVPTSERTSGKISKPDGPAINRIRPRPSCGVCGGTWLINRPLLGVQRIATCRIIQCEADAEYYAEGVEELCYCADHVPKVMVGLRTTVRRTSDADQSTGGTGVVAAPLTRESGDAGEPFALLDSAIERGRAGNRDLAGDRDGGSRGQRDVAAESGGGCGEFGNDLDPLDPAMRRGRDGPDGGGGSSIGQRDVVRRRRRGCGAVGYPLGAPDSANERGRDLFEGGGGSSSGQRYAKPSYSVSGSPSELSSTEPVRIQCRQISCVDAATTAVRMCAVHALPWGIRSRNEHNLPMEHAPRKCRNLGCTSVADTVVALCDDHARCWLNPLVDAWFDCGWDEALRTVKRSASPANTAEGAKSASPPVPVTATQTPERLAWARKTMGRHGDGRHDNWPSFGFVSDPRAAEACFQQKRVEAKSPAGERCGYSGCVLRASHGVPNSVRYEFCVYHKLDGMVDIDGAMECYL